MDALAFPCLRAEPLCGPRIRSVAGAPKMDEHRRTLFVRRASPSQRNEADGRFSGLCLKFKIPFVTSIPLPHQLIQPVAPETLKFLFRPPLFSQGLPELRGVHR